jgi:phosphoglycolate phosphatase
MPDLIVFDLDGTLVDSRQAIVSTFQDACQTHGHAEPPAGEIAARIGLPLHRMFGELVGSDVDALVASFRNLYLGHDAVHSRVFAGAHDLLGGLTSPLAIATSKRQKGAEASVGRHGLAPYFTHVLGHDQVARPKPNPDMLWHLLDRANVTPDRAVMVGDTRFDLEMADAAGVRGIGVAWGMHAPERLSDWPVAQSFDELASLL